MAIHKYRVRAGFTYGAQDQWKAGSVLELEESVAVYNLDKLELAEIVHNIPHPSAALPPPPSLPAFPPESEEKLSTDDIDVEKTIYPPKKKTLRKKSTGG